MDESINYLRKLAGMEPLSEGRMKNFSQQKNESLDRNALKKRLHDLGYTHQQDGITGTISIYSGNQKIAQISRNGRMSFHKSLLPKYRKELKQKILSENQANQDQRYASSEEPQTEARANIGEDGDQFDTREIAPYDDEKDDQTTPLEHEIDQMLPIDRNSEFDGAVQAIEVIEKIKQAGRLSDQDLEELDRIHRQIAISVQNASYSGVQRGIDELESWAFL